MNQRFTAFLLAAETLSISKAAELNFVSYQCISSHIRSLEEEYGVKLFDRHPKFALTEEGCVLLASLQKIRAIEGGDCGILKRTGEGGVRSCHAGHPHVQIYRDRSRHPRPIQGGI